jgi:FkbM family methyltransferase
LLEPGALTFDIGANHGQTTEKLLRPGCKVIAVEPGVENVEVLKMKFKHNPSVTVVSKGVSDKDEILPFYFNKTQNRSSSFIEKWNQGAECHYSVRVTTLDKLIEKFGRPQFIKIDVEGFELRVLKGLTQRVPSLSFSYHGRTWDETLEGITLVNKLGKARYNFNSFIMHSLHLENWVDSEGLVPKIKKSMENGHYYGDIFARIE